MSGQKLQPGDMAPEFEVFTDMGELVRLSDYHGKRVIIYFYPKDDTPGCTTQACGFRDAYPGIEEKNTVVLGVSPDGIKSHQKFKAKFDLPFTLLADESRQIAEAYGVWGERTRAGKTSMGIIRSHFVIDEDGKLLDVQFDISPGQSVEQALLQL